MPQPAQREQHNVHSCDGHAEHEGCLALPAHSSLAEVCIHNAHGDEVEEEVPPVQVNFLRGAEGGCLEGAKGLCTAACTKAIPQSGSTEDSS